MLYAFTQPGLDDPGKAAGYVVNRLLAGEPPPPRFQDWALLTRRDWRTLWRAAQYGGAYRTNLRPELAQMFDDWCSDFADVFPEGPFGDEVIDANLIRAIIAELEGDPAMFEIYVPQRGGVINIKPSHAAAQEWLRRMERLLRTKLQQRGVYHRLRILEDLAAANVSPESGELGEVWSKALEILRTRLARSVFEGLLLGSQLVELKESACVIAVRDDYAQAWAQEKLSRHAAETLSSLLGRPVDAAFVSLASLGAPPSPG